MSILGLIIAVLLIFLLIWAIRTLAAAFDIPPQIQAVLTALIVVIFCLWIIGQLTAWNVGPILRLR